MVTKSALQDMIQEVFEESGVEEHDLRRALVDRFAVDFAEEFEDDDPEGEEGEE